MNGMRRILAAFVCAAMLVSLAACGASGTSAASATAVQEANGAYDVIAEAPAEDAAEDVLQDGRKIVLNATLTLEALDFDSVCAALEQAASAANAAVYQRACADPDCRGMGTTMVAALIMERTAYLLNIGDSRAYHLSHSSNSIYQITRDHSLVEELVEFGAITKEQAKNHPQRNVITRALGSEENVESDYFEFTLQSGDILLLCSDGLSNMVTDLEMLDYANEYQDPELVCRSLMSKALKRGARDNVTVLAVMK